MGENFFDVIFYSFYIFEGNYLEFKTTIQSYMQFIANSNYLFDAQIQHEFNIQASRELGRLIHNYAAAWLSLVDQTRVIYQKLDKAQRQDIRSFAAEYKNKLDESLKNRFENVFVKELRNYVQHKAVAVPSPYVRFKRVDSSLNTEQPLADISFSFELQTKYIQDFDWKSLNKYVKTNQSIPVEEIIDKHFEMMKDFYLWIRFRDHQLHPYCPEWIRQSTFEEWKQRQEQEAVS